MRTPIYGCAYPAGTEKFADTLFPEIVAVALAPAKGTSVVSIRVATIVVGTNATLPFTVADEPAWSVRVCAVRLNVSLATGIFSEGSPKIENIAARVGT